MDIDYKPPVIAATFLVNFDTSLGYKFVWSKSKNDLDLNGLEYKSMPLGLHDSQTDTILLSHKVGAKIYYGIARFYQNIKDFGENEQVDRKNVKMYSVGVLCEPLNSPDWIPNEFVNNGWEYVDELDLTLKKFIARRSYENFDLFEDLYEKLSNTTLQTPKPGLRFSKVIENHPLTRLPSFLQTLGPLTFCLYKQALLRKRILFFQQNQSKSTNYDVGSFTYLLSLISIIPKGVEAKRGNNNNGNNRNLIESNSDDLFSRAIFSIGLNDLGGTLAGSPSSIGCTNDSILMYQRNIFDYATFIPCEEDNEPFIIGSKHLINNHGHTPTLSDGELKATLKDYYKFKLVYKDYFNIHRKSGSSLQDNDDTSSIKTKSSSFSTRFGSQFMKLTNPKEFGEIDLEPSWWLETATSPISWREYIWSAFSWFASAGSVESSYKNGEDECEENREGINEDDDNVSSGSSDELKKNFIELVEIIGNFHKLTKKWFYLINEVVSDVLDVELIEGTSQSLLSGNVHQLEKKIKIELTYQDIIDMELDPYSHEDLEFVKQFVLLYWNETVESVEIGLGLSGICC